MEPTIVACSENRQMISKLFENLGAYEIGVDVETNTANPKEPNAMRDELVGVGVAIYAPSGSPAYGYHVETFYGDVQREPWFQSLLRDMLSRASGYYAHNALYDATVLRRHGIVLPRLLGDGRIAAYLLGQPEAGLKPLLQEWFEIETQDFSELLNEYGVKRISDVPVEAVAQYCGSQDAQMCVPLAREMCAKLSPRVREVYSKVELPMVGILLDMTMKGIPFNREAAIPKLDATISAREGLDRIIAEMIRSTGFTQYEMKDGIPYRRTCPACHNGKKKRLGCTECQGAGLQPVRIVDFNPGSPKQVRAWLYDHMRFPTRRYGQGVQPWMIEKGIVAEEELIGSTDALALLQLQTQHPVIPMMLARRHFKKDEGFLKGWIAASEADGRIHAQFTNTTVASGRLSCHDPNLQQVQMKWRELFESEITA